MRNIFKQIKPYSEKQKQKNDELKEISIIIWRDRAYECQCCERSKLLALAHIIPRRFKLFFAVIENLYILCQDCHTALDGANPLYLYERNKEFYIEIFNYMCDNDHKNRAYRMHDNLMNQLGEEIQVEYTLS